MLSELRVGVALGGGAARGLAHVGVLRALTRAGIDVQFVGGTSFGALVGSLFAAAGDIEDVERRLRSFIRSAEFAHMRLRFLREEARPPSSNLFYSFSNLLKKGIVLGYSVAKPSFVSAEEFARHISALLPDIAVEDTRIPLVVVAADLNSGKELDIRSGSLLVAVSGSCAIPGVLPPTPRDGQLLIDGGWVNKVPVRPVLEMGAEFVVAVDVAADLEDTRSYRSGLNILTRANAICSNRLRELQLQEADLVIRPQVGGIHWADFSRLEEAIALGEQAVAERLPELKARLARARTLSRFRFWRQRRRRA